MDKGLKVGNYTNCTRVKIIVNGCHGKLFCHMTSIAFLLDLYTKKANSRHIMYNIVGIKYTNTIFL